MKCRQGKGFVAFLAKQVQDFERIVLQNLASSSSPIGYCPNASPVLIQQTLIRAC
ncbi:MAG: hypothetical protein GPJ21_15630 [Microcystis aeruginosa W13-11]|nr:hypothetical protein [Microcystis aeruginosa W13-11]